MRALASGDPEFWLHLALWTKPSTLGDCWAYQEEGVLWRLGWNWISCHSVHMRLTFGNLEVHFHNLWCKQEWSRFLHITSFNLQNNPMRQVLLLLSFPKWGNWGTEKFPKVIQPDLKTISIMKALAGCWVSTQSPHQDGDPTVHLFMGPPPLRRRSSCHYENVVPCVIFMGFGVCILWLYSYQNEVPKLLMGCMFAWLLIVNLL